MAGIGRGKTAYACLSLRPRLLSLRSSPRLGEVPYGGRWHCRRLFWAEPPPGRGLGAWESVLQRQCIESCSVKADREGR